MLLGYYWGIIRLVLDIVIYRDRHVSEFTVHFHSGHSGRCTLSSSAWAASPFHFFPSISNSTNQLSSTTELLSNKPMLLRTNWIVLIPWILVAVSLQIERCELATCCAHFCRYFSLPIESTELVLCSQSSLSCLNRFQYAQFGHSANQTALSGMR